MMAPVTALASYMAQVEGAVLPPVFVEDGLVIVESKSDECGKKAPVSRATVVRLVKDARQPEMAAAA